MLMYASSRVKRKSFYRKSELQMFLLISGGHIGGRVQRKLILQLALWASCNQHLLARKKFFTRMKK